MRPYFRHNPRLFSEISRLIFATIERFYTEAASRPIKTGMVLAYQTSGEFFRLNPCCHAVVLEGGFDETGRFVHIPFGNLIPISFQDETNYAVLSSWQDREESMMRW